MSIKHKVSGDDYGYGSGDGYGYGYGSGDGYGSGEKYQAKLGRPVKSTTLIA